MTVILLFLAVLFTLVVIIQVARSIEYSAIIKGKDTSESNSKWQGYLSIIFLIGGSILAIWSLDFFKGRFLPESASEHGKIIDSAFNTTLIFTTIVFVITQVLLFFFVFKYRQRKNRAAHYFPDNNKLEMAWTIIPAIVLTILVIQGITGWYKIFSPAPENAVEFEVTGKQFEWIIRYPGKDGVLGERGKLSEISPTNSLALNWNDPAAKDDILPTEIYLPVNVPVSVRINALDVLHSFFLPHFRVKMDAVPGTPTTFWFTPTITTEQMKLITGNPDFNYELACAELCGIGHSSMRRVVKVVSEQGFKDWVAKQTPYFDQVGQAAIEAGPDVAEGETSQLIEIIEQ